METDRTGTIYWEWKALDHLDIMDVTHDIDLKMQIIDFAHINSFSETADGNLIISLRNLDEIIKINKSTGNIVWRFGGKMSAGNQFTFLNDEVDGFTGFSHQHSVSELPNGNILMFDNGTLRDNKFSRAVEYSLDTINYTAVKVWEHRNSPDIYQGIMGSAERLPNGNTLINWATSKIVEVRPDNSIAFEFAYNCGPEGNGSFYRVHKYITMMNAVTLPVSSTGNYIFSNQKFNTDVTLSLSSVSGTGSATIEKHNYAPPKDVYSDSSFIDIIPARWVLTKIGRAHV